MLKKMVLGAVFALTSLLHAGITGAGASFPAPLYFDWAYYYQKETGKEVNYQSIGSGGGIQQITARKVSFGASDAPLTPEQQKKAKLFQFPAVVGSIVITYNLDGIKDGELKLTNELVADIFAGKVTKWNDPKITKVNPGVQLPQQNIVVVHRSDGSGTTFNFTYYLSKASEMWKKSIGNAKSVEWPAGIGGKGNEGVTNLVKQTPNSIGYIEYAYKLKNRLPAATLQTASGKWVKATEDNFKAAAAYAKWKASEGFYELLALQPGDNSYPIVAATFILLPMETKEVDQQVTAFYNYGYEKGQNSAVKLGYIPLPKQTVDMIQKYWKDNGISPAK